MSANTIMLPEKYSFSRLDSFKTCKKAWKFKYLDKLKGVSNAFAEHGTLIHDILERFGKGEIKPNEDMVNEFLARFDEEVISPYPIFSAKINLREHYKYKYSLFLSKFKGFSGKVISTEHYFEKEIEDNILYRGYIDLITESDDYVSVIDFKSGNKFTKKELAKKKFQLLLYYPIVKEMYPDKEVKLFFYFVKEGDVKEIEVDDTEMKDAIEFARETIDEINREEDFDYALKEDTVKKMSFFCNNICGYRDICEAKKNLIIKKVNYEDVVFDNVESNRDVQNVSLSKRIVKK